ncbi:unnamed protein product [Echinostoma caproni]|uniref:FABD domain-containing protein n=1 Tax=Echinostoma caproni TaxID=27848 RepID=A0A183AVV8_9TREM|nr:unnamed protein product [Echinostoma caproni]
MATAPRRPRPPQQYRKVAISEENEEDERSGITSYPDESDPHMSMEDPSGSTSLSASNSLGRKRAAPCPPRRTTPVKPFPSELTHQLFPSARPSVSTTSSERDLPGEDDLFPLPPPTDGEAFNGSVTGVRTPSFQTGHFAISTPPPPQSSIPPPTPGGFQIPSVMSTSGKAVMRFRWFLLFNMRALVRKAAIFPSSSSMEPNCGMLKPARPAFLPHTNPSQTKPDGVGLRPVKSPSHTKPSSCDKASPADESSFAGETGQPFGRSEGKMPGSKVETSTRLCASGQSETRIPVSKLSSSSSAANAEFRHELERRLQQQHQTQGHPYDRPSTSFKLTRSSKQSAAEQKQSQPASPTTTITCGFLTVPRKKSVQSTSVTPIAVTVDRPIVRANPPSPSPSPNGSQASPNAFYPTSVTQPHSRSLKTATEPQQQQPTGLPKPMLRSPKRSAPPWVNPQTVMNPAPSASNPAASKSNEQSTKRLSWTGPDRLHRPSDAGGIRSQRFCLPTILSNSSTGLDSVELADQNQAPSRQHLTNRLTELVQRLEALRTDDSEPEQVIACAEQLEACRLDCSAFIDQATCSARAKFAFRDRYAPLQQLSTNLRLNRSKQSPDPVRLVSTAVTALQNILTELSKLNEGESSATSGLDGQEEEDEEEVRSSIDNLRDTVPRPLRFAPVPTKLPQFVSE